ncbi:MAG: hypothetical protein R3F62_27470 [Planctomycetota bacterium]
MSTRSAYPRAHHAGPAARRRVAAYPFSPEAIEAHGPALAWPGRIPGYERAGYARTGPHWLSSEQATRFIYRKALPSADRA